MANPNPYGVMFKVTVYLFDLISDWVNGILLLMPRDSVGTNTSDYNINTMDGGNCSFEETEGHLAWGSLTISLSWVPALVGMVMVIMDSGVGGRWGCILLPVRFILWPLIIPIVM